MDEKKCKFVNRMGLTNFQNWITMKCTLFLISMVFATTIIFSQNYFIGFEAKGLTTIVDSVKVENLTQLTKLSLSGVDVLHLTGAVGMNNLSQNEGTVVVNPNPMQGQAELLFYTKQAGNARIIIYDIAGKDVAQISGKILAGAHKYGINGLKEGSYIINIVGQGFQYNFKLISKNSFQNKASIKYLGTTKQEDYIKTFKNTRSTIDMAYTIGDSLRFTGYSASYKAIVKDVPTADKTITFTFLALPEISTTSISAITDSSAISGGNVTSDGGDTVTARGVCWGTNPNPSLDNNFTSDSSGMGSYASKITGIIHSTLYYVRAYAKNSLGTAYGNNLSFIRTKVPDIDGNLYDTVIIGTQCWMKQNLKTIHYRNADPIPCVLIDSTWTSITDTGAYCNYNNDTSTTTTFGRLYNWYAVSDSRKVCPTGWHVPTDAEWTILENYLMANRYNYDGKTTGNNYAKAMASDKGWVPNSGIGTVGNSDYPAKRNATGFTALPTGWRFPTGKYYDLGYLCYWWSSTEFSPDLAYNRNMSFNNSYVSRNFFSKLTGFSVRCLKN